MIETDGKKFNEFCKIVGAPEIGEGTWIGFFTLIDGSGGLTIGKNCDIASGVHIYTHDTVKRCIENKRFNKDGTINREEVSRALVKIGNNVFIGANSIILKKVEIEDNAVIGAGSVVLSGTKIKKGETWAGNPAKLVK